MPALLKTVLLVTAAAYACSAASSPGHQQRDLDQPAAGPFQFNWVNPYDKPPYGSSSRRAASSPTPDRSSAPRYSTGATSPAGSYRPSSAPRYSTGATSPAGSYRPSSAPRYSTGAT
ncbi:hypothetical protein BX600DRAFT_438414 [Xylariales sp. PMI_506]|nr:hypothetical protein BX600DRAFT_438414 [Xylariales sp. PMI_506]